MSVTVESQPFIVSTTETEESESEISFESILRKHTIAGAHEGEETIVPLAIVSQVVKSIHRRINKLKEHYSERLKIISEKFKQFEQRNQLELESITNQLVDYAEKEREEFDVRIKKLQLSFDDLQKESFDLSDNLLSLSNETLDLRKEAEMKTETLIETKKNFDNEIDIALQDIVKRLEATSISLENTKDFSSKVIKMFIEYTSSFFPNDSIDEKTKELEEFSALIDQIREVYQDIVKTVFVSQSEKVNQFDQNLSERLEDLADLEAKWLDNQTRWSEPVELVDSEQQTDDLGVLPTAEEITLSLNEFISEKEELQFKLNALNEKKVVILEKQKESNELQKEIDEVTERITELNNEKTELLNKLTSFQPIISSFIESYRKDHHGREPSRRDYRQAGLLDEMNEFKELKKKIDKLTQKLKKLDRVGVSKQAELNILGGGLHLEGDIEIIKEGIGMYELIKQLNSQKIELSSEINVAIEERKSQPKVRENAVKVTDLSLLPFTQKLSELLQTTILEPSFQEVLAEIASLQTTLSQLLTKEALDIAIAEFNNTHIDRSEHDRIVSEIKKGPDGSMPLSEHQRQMEELHQELEEQEHLENLKKARDSMISNKELQKEIKRVMKEEEELVHKEYVDYIAPKEHEKILKKKEREIQKELDAFAIVRAEKQLMFDEDVENMRKEHENTLADLLRTFKNEMNRFRGDLDLREAQMVQQLETLAKHKKKTEGSVEKTEKKMHGVKQELNALRAQQRDVERVMAQIVKVREQGDKRLAGLTADHASDMQKAQEKFERGIKSISGASQNPQLDAKMQSLKETVSSLTGEVETKESTVAEHNITIAELNNTVEDKVKGIEELSKFGETFEKLEGDLSSTKKQLKKLKKAGKQAVEQAKSEKKERLLIQTDFERAVGCGLSFISLQNEEANVINSSTFELCGMTNVVDRVGKSVTMERSIGPLLEQLLKGQGTNMIVFGYSKDEFLRGFEKLCSVASRLAHKKRADFVIKQHCFVCSPLTGKCAASDNDLFLYPACNRVQYGGCEDMDPENLGEIEFNKPLGIMWQLNVKNKQKPHVLQTSIQFIYVPSDYAFVLSEFDHMILDKVEDVSSLGCLISDSINGNCNLIFDGVVGTDSSAPAVLRTAKLVKSVQNLPASYMTSKDIKSQVDEVKNIYLTLLERGIRPFTRADPVT
ncbi:hypothetical protein PCE1_001701 [Barthelona sp. PCE]